MEIAQTDAGQDDKKKSESKITSKTYKAGSDDDPDDIKLSLAERLLNNNKASSSTNDIEEDEEDEENTKSNDYSNKKSRNSKNKKPKKVKQLSEDEKKNIAFWANQDPEAKRQKEINQTKLKEQKAKEAAK